MDNNMKDLAKELYFKEVQNKEWRDSFLEKLSKREVIDKRDQGFCCSYCGRFGKELAFSSRDKTIFPKGNSDELWIVNSHYDGCRGWD